ncbi:TITAN-like protein [Zea mays]|uniref:TITAN-like protein n=1 Tax=Zea mays TaxID=4577 RepID=A0A3L6DZH3_MAIZE|nr:TITAN-like protein [Zea mays]
MPGATAMPPPAVELEYCELCRHHHDHGRRHHHIMKHMRNLEDALTSFCSKLSDLRRAFLHGSPSSQPPRGRHWCPFCSTDIVDLDSRSAGNNAIYHLASSQHLKGVNNFLQKHGGRMRWTRLGFQRKCLPSSGSASYSSPYGACGLPITHWGSVETHKQQDVLSTNWFHSSGPATKGHQSTLLVNDTRQLISCTDHVSLYHMHTHRIATYHSKQMYNTSPDVGMDLITLATR